jgi:hypothetical protein
MSDQSKGFDRKALPRQAIATGHGTVMNPVEGKRRIAAEALRLAEIKELATPPAAMQAAPMAPARGPQQLVPSVTVIGGGMRRVEGAHFRALSPVAAMVAQARLRHDARHGDSDRTFVPPFTPAQITMAEDYAALVEWREGSALRCASLEAGRAGGGGSGLFIDSFVDQGNWLAELRRRIGTDVAMSVRRHMDRGNTRRSITVRAAVDMLCLGGQDLSTILRRYGWAEKGSHRSDLRTAISGALDRMQGYRD